jgi:hypothetical protein
MGEHQATPVPPDAVIFDFDGLLMDTPGTLPLLGRGPIPGGCGFPPEPDTLVKSGCCVCFV